MSTKKKYPTKKAMISKLVNDVENWDIDNLIGWIQFEYKIKLKKLSAQEVADQYEQIFPEEFE